MRRSGTGGFTEERNWHVLLSQLGGRGVVSASLLMQDETETVRFSAAETFFVRAGPPVLTKISSFLKNKEE